MGGRSVFSISAATTTPSATSARTNRPAALCIGRLRPLVLPDGPTGMSYTREGEIIKCPWHQWEFDIKTGQALYDPKLRVRTYRVEVDGEQVVLHA